MVEAETPQTISDSVSKWIEETREWERILSLQVGSALKAMSEGEQVVQGMIAENDESKKVEDVTK